MIATARDAVALAPACAARARGQPALWDGKRPESMEGWVSLGREVFFRYPLRREVFVEWALGHPEVGARVGVRAAADGTYPGVVVFVDTRGESQIGMTCAICHADAATGQAVVGRARRDFDYGALRLAYHAATGTTVDAQLARRMRTWGPGRADVTEDDDEDPVAVPDLWSLRRADFLTQAGTIKHTPTALAIRQETQLLTSNHQTVRPPRELAFALAMFLYSLKPPPSTPAGDPAWRRAEKRSSNDSARAVTRTPTAAAAWSRPTASPPTARSRTAPRAAPAPTERRCSCASPLRRRTFTTARSRRSRT